MKNRGLGKGLSALLKEELMPVSSDELVKIIDIDKLEAGPFQPRKKFEIEKIQELGNSIKQDGVLQPLIVMTPEKKGEKYQIIAGERRWRAAQLVGMTHLPVIIKDYTNAEILKISILENIQREALSSIEEAESYGRLLKEFGYTQEQLSEILCKSRSHISNLIRLTTLPQSIKDKINDGTLSMGHARCLVGHRDAEEIARYIIDHDLNVRHTEKAVKNWKKKKDSKTVKTGKRSSVTSVHNNSDIHLLSELLSKKFGMKVTVEELLVGGRVIFHCENMEELDILLERLS